jgi:hypothetical protein
LPSPTHAIQPRALASARREARRVVENALEAGVADLFYDLRPQTDDLGDVASGLLAQRSSPVRVGELLVLLAEQPILFLGADLLPFVVRIGRTFAAASCFFSSAASVSAFDTALSRCCSWRAMTICIRGGKVRNSALSSVVHDRGGSGNSAPGMRSNAASTIAVRVGFARHDASCISEIASSTCRSARPANWTMPSTKPATAHGDAGKFFTPRCAHPIEEWLQEPARLGGELWGLELEDVDERLRERGLGLRLLEFLLAHDLAEDRVLAVDRCLNRTSRTSRASVSYLAYESSTSTSLRSPLMMRLTFARTASLFARCSHIR